MPFRNDDAFPTTLFIGILATLCILYIWRDPQPPARSEAPPTALQGAIERGDIARTPVLEDQCEALMVDPERDRQLTAEELKQKSIAYAQCLGVDVVDCAVTPADPLCKGPPR